MLTITFPFIPPTANHAQKSRIVKSKAKPFMVRYNTPRYNSFKQDVERHLSQLDEATMAELVAILQAPHMVFMTIASPNVLKKDGTTHKTFGDSANFEKTLVDSIYNYFGVNDTYAYIPVPNKTVSDSIYTQVSWLPFKSWNKKDFIFIECIKDVVKGI